MQIDIRFNENTENITVRTPLNTFVEAYDDYFQEYVVVALAETIPDYNGSGYLVANCR